MKKNRYFLTVTFITSLTLFIFVFWLGFPGYFQAGDIYNSLAVNTNHWHPVIIARFIETLYSLFGKHSFYLFALNIFCFFSGLWFFISALYIRTKNVFWYVLFSLTFVGNIFFQNFVQYNSFTLPMMLWLGCSMVFFQILVKIENSYVAFTFRFLTATVFLFALLWRHNAIFSIYPLFLLFIYIFMENRNGITRKTKYLFHFVSLMLISACILVLIVKGHPHLLSDNISKTSANHVFLHQIAGATVPENDGQLIPREWYEKNKNFEDVKEMYMENTTFADPFYVFWEPYGSNLPFKKGGLKNLEKVWFEAILAYPFNWLSHVAGFYKEMWFQSPGWVFDSTQIQEPPVHPWHVRVASNFSENERSIVFTPLQKKIYDFLYKNKLLLNHSVGISIGLLVLIIGSCFWLVFPACRHPILLFSISTSLSSFCTANMVCIFSPTTDARYMSSVLVLSLIGLIGFIAWCYLFLSEHFKTGERKTKPVSVLSKLTD